MNMNYYNTNEIVMQIKVDQLKDQIEEQTGKKVASITVDRNGMVKDYELVNDNGNLIKKIIKNKYE